jgi:hypothetical protein
MLSRRQIFVIALALSVLAAPALAGAVAGLPGPVFGISTAPNGDILVADASTGVYPIRNGTVGKAKALPGVTDVSPIGGGSLWATTGAGDDPQQNTGQGLHRVSNGKNRLIADLFEFEATVNPDAVLGHDAPDSNPFDVQALGGGAALVADAGGNDLLRVDNQGHIAVLAVFPDELVPTTNFADLVEMFGCPFGPPEACELPPAMPAEAVPTSIAVGPDGWYYVGELKGFPGPAGESRIWKVSPNANGDVCPNPDCVLVFDGGFTSIIDLAFGPDGDLYVAELDEGSWAAVEIFQQPLGGTINECNVVTKACSEVAGDIPILTSITFGKDGSLWATKNALIPNAVEVFEVS